MTIDHITHAFAKRDYQLAEQYCFAYLQQQKPEPFIEYIFALAKLHNGHLIDGLRGYKARWAMPEMQQLKRQLVQYGRYTDTWEDIQNKTLIITGEQGFGDELMFSRVLKNVHLACAKLLVISSKEVQSLLQFNHPEIEFIGMGEPLKHRMKEFQSITTTADMWRAYALYHGTLPPVPHYAAKHPIFVSRSKRKLGFVYQAGSTGDNSAERSLSPDIFAELVNDFELYSFQMPVGDRLPFPTQYFGNFRSFLDTANHLATMDIVVSCDTSFAHLALNMGKPTIMVYDEYLDWRWKNSIYPEATVIHYRSLPDVVRSLISSR